VKEKNKKNTKQTNKKNHQNQTKTHHHPSKHPQPHTSVTNSTLKQQTTGENAKLPDAVGLS